MKNRKLRIVARLLAVILMISVVLTGCAREEVVGIKKAKINKNGELVITYTDGSQENLGVVVGQDGKDGKDGQDASQLSGSDVTVATANALRSAVSIYCTFTGADGEYYSAGSGVIYQLDKAAGNAFIITNHHVVFDVDSDTENGISPKIEVLLYGSELDGFQMEAEYVGGSQHYDIAVLYIENSDVLKGSDVQAIQVADSDEIVVGQTAIAVGNAEGEGITATSGIVSVDSEHITMTAADNKTEVSYRVMRVDTAVNHGNSGGGLFNDKGEFIGIVNAKIIDGEVENIGYAIPSRVAIGVADNIIDHCFGTDCESVMRAMLGVTVINTASSAVYDAQTGTMRIVDTVEVYEISDTSAAKGVLKTGDVLVSATLNGETRQLTRQHHVVDLMLLARAGDTVELTVLRDGKEKTVAIQITEEHITEY